MGERKTTKRTLLAASALAIAAAASAHAAPALQTAAPTEVVTPAAHPADETRAAPAALQKAGLAAAATAALAALVHFIGAGRIRGWLRSAAPVAAKAARAAARAPVEAAKAVGRAAASPLRFALVMAGLGVFALTGFSLFDVEWAGGLLAGGALVALAWFAAGRVRRRLVAIRRAPTRGKGV